MRRNRLWLALALGVSALGVGATLLAWDRPAHHTGPTAPMALTGRVVDNANVLDARERAALSARLERLEREVGPQLVVATTPSLGGRRIEEYSLDLARGWQLGDARRNDGLLVLVAPTERKMRIEVGTGLERTLPDDLCAAIIKRDMLPLFANNQTSNGVNAGVDRLIAILEAHPTKPRVSP